MDRDALLNRVGSHPRVALSHLPTPFEPMHSLTGRLGGADLYCKRDDCTGLAFGGNKVRQLEFHLGRAIEENATTVLITGAVQSNYVRTTAAAAARLGLRCEVQLESRVHGQPEAYDNSGNVLLDRLFGATVHRFAVGEDEDGADGALDTHAERVRSEGGQPYVIHLGVGHSPIGALGYVTAAVELMDDAAERERNLEAVVVASGSAATHAGLLVGLRTLGYETQVYGICVRRRAEAQRVRVLATVRGVEALLGLEPIVSDEDVCVSDTWFGEAYGHPDDTTFEALRLAARCEALVLDPVYTGKSFAGLVGLVRDGTLAHGTTAAWIHTGGTPALFAYEQVVRDALAP